MKPLNHRTIEPLGDASVQYTTVYYSTLYRIVQHTRTGKKCPQQNNESYRIGHAQQNQQHSAYVIAYVIATSM